MGGFVLGAMADVCEFDFFKECAMPAAKETEYRVLLVNDTETPMDFVVDVLQRFST
jgi:ATP-dependent Clp protease adapter protein ClpS